MTIRDDLKNLGENIRDAYARNRRVMSFAEYLDLVAAAPKVHLRSAPQYIRDCFDYYGSEDVKYPAGKVRRFKLFDVPWAEGRDALVGQEEVQNRVYRALNNFVNEGVSNKLVLLHGPNGSAKSTFVRCMGRALQDYSGRDEGAVYRINWIFPAQKISRGGIGFGGTEIDGHTSGDSYAYLPEELVDAKLHDELRDHPMFLIPKGRRAELMREMLGDDSDHFVLSDYLLHGQLSPKNRTVYEALLTSYQGDYLKVLRHVQVQRYFIGHRYREGYATVEPQLSVDATERQITADRSVAALPAALQSAVLHEYAGELVFANRGLIEYSDLLKRPLEAYKYLLTTVERSCVALPNATLYLDLMFIGSSNEIHLQAFKEIPEFQSFRGRLELVRVPYLLDYMQEARIYRDKLHEAAHSRHVAPHCDYVAALWAVLTRMRKPMSDKYPKAIGELVARLSPLEKAELYAEGKVPDSMSATQARDLRAHLRDVQRESEGYPNYEGRTGASPRELQVVIFNAANSSAFSYVSPQAVLAEIAELCKQTSVYDFLKQEALPGGYHDALKFIDLCRQRLLDKTDDEVRSAMGLVAEDEYERLFQRYINHVTHWIRNEKVRNPTTGKMEEPDQSMMRQVERTLDVDEKNGENFRGDLIAKIGAWSLDNKDAKPDYSAIFPEHFRRIRDAYFEQRKKTVSAGVTDMVKLLTGSAGMLAPEAKRRAQSALDDMVARFGYSQDSARDAVLLLARERYTG